MLLVTPYSASKSLLIGRSLVRCVKEFLQPRHLTLSLCWKSSHTRNSICLCLWSPVGCKGPCFIPYGPSVRITVSSRNWLLCGFLNTKSKFRSWKGTSVGKGLAIQAQEPAFRSSVLTEKWDLLFMSISLVLDRQKQGDPGAYWPANLRKTARFWFSDRSCLKK